MHMPTEIDVHGLYDELKVHIADFALGDGRWQAEPLLWHLLLQNRLTRVTSEWIERSLSTEERQANKVFFRIVCDANRNAISVRETGTWSVVFTLTIASKVWGKTFVFPQSNDYTGLKGTI